ncbi:hypothetical protein GQ42DRAFT_159867 [Ramicandelaber brevisporus]|nr:hypothetical protein GQ42DRAFT_159867 [Ramicandelaber brevisporus]
MDIDSQERFKGISAGVLVRLKAYHDCEEQAGKLRKWFSNALDFADKFELDQIEPPSEWSRKIFKKIEELLQESHWRVGYHVILKMRLKDGKAALKQAFVDERPALLVHFAKLKREMEDATIIASKPNGNKSKRTATTKLPSRVTKKPKTTHTDQPVSTTQPKTVNSGPRTKKQKVAPSEA